MKTPRANSFSIFCARYNAEAAHMRFRNDERFAAVFWADRNIGYTLSGPPDRPRLQAVAQLVYEQVDRPAQTDQKPEK